MPTFVVGHNKAEISYQISIYATTPGKLYGSNTTCVHSTSVNIVAAPPQPDAPQRIEDCVKITRYCCIPAGTIELAVTPSASAIQSGDRLAITYEVENQSSQDVSYVNVSFEQHISWSAHGQPSSLSTIIGTTRVAGVAKGTGSGFNKSQVFPEADSSISGRDQNNARSVMLQVPDLTCFTAVSPTINVTYVVKVKADTKNSRDLTVSLPIHAYRPIPGAAASGAVQVNGNAPDVLVATVVGIEYPPNPDFIVEVIEPPIQAVLVT